MSTILTSDVLNLNYKIERIIMSGKRQHFIPQFLQRGFVSHKKGDKFYTWVFRKDIQPFNSNIENVGVEGYFYTINNDYNLDNKITDIENRFGSIISIARNTRTIDGYSSQNFGELIAHLEIRTRHLRENLLKLTSSIFGNLFSFLEDEEQLNMYIANKLFNNPRYLVSFMSDDLKGQGLDDKIIFMIAEVIQKNIVEKGFIQLIPHYEEFINQMKEGIKNKLMDTIKGSHINALNNYLAPDLKIQIYSNLKYELVQLNDDIPLSDAMVLFHIDSKKREFKPFLEKDDNLIAVILPISTNIVLIGCREKYIFDLQKIRHEIIKSSCEYFISSVVNEDLIEESKNISQNSYIISRDELKGIFDEVLLI